MGALILKQPKVVFKNVVKEYTLFRKSTEKVFDFFLPEKVNRSFYAIKNVSFEVYSGETIGIIGINGSGKSTLSNLLAQVVPPTSGSININGETSLIAISVGLNNQLSGLENIELKCLMHGMKMEEINRIKPLIIEFADIGDFIEQPVKNYSSGMRSRLGFAISVHTNPDILVVDEALSVGDQTFYTKCMTKINEFKDAGKTIFFISHSISQIKQLSDRVLWMHFGEVKEFGETKKVIKHYKAFINWFNGLTEKEKKQYKNKMLKRQSSIKPYEAETENGLSRTNKRRKGKKRNIDILYNIQLISLSTLLMFSLIFMVGQEKVYALLAKLEIVNISKADKEVLTDKIEPESGAANTKDIKEAFVQLDSASVFENADLTNPKKTLRFGEKVKIVEYLDENVYKIQQNDETGYILADNINSSDVDIEEINISITELLPMLNTSFNESYQYYLTFLGGEESSIQAKMQGITEELYDNDRKMLVLGHEGITYLITDGKATGINIGTSDKMPVDLEERVIGKSITSKDGQLIAFKSPDYNFILNYEASEISIELKDENI